MAWRGIAVPAVLLSTVVAAALTCSQELWTERVERDLAERLHACGAGYHPASQPDVCVSPIDSADNPCVHAGKAMRAEAGNSRCGDALLVWERGPYDGHDCFFDASSGVLVGWARWSDGNQFCGAKSARVVAGQFPSGWR